jgi:hypothetical protein
MRRKRNLFQSDGYALKSTGGRSLHPTLTVACVTGIR